jgi:hypothetical protein
VSLVPDLEFDVEWLAVPVSEELEVTEAELELETCEIDVDELVDSLMREVELVTPTVEEELVDDEE